MKPNIETAASVYYTHAHSEICVIVRGFKTQLKVSFSLVRSQISPMACSSDQWWLTTSLRWNQWPEMAENWANISHSIINPLSLSITYFLQPLLGAHRHNSTQEPTLNCVSQFIFTEQKNKMFWTTNHTGLHWLPYEHRSTFLKISSFVTQYVFEWG